MTRFFFSVFLPMSVVGAAAALVLYTTGRALYRIEKTRWGVQVLLAALCLFVLPLTAPRLPHSPQSVPAGDSEKMYMLSPLQQEISTAITQALPEESAVVREEKGAPEKDAAETEPAAPLLFHGVLPRILPWLWLAGIAAVTMETGVSYRKFCRRLKKESREISDAFLQDRLACAARASGLKRPVALRETAMLASPMAVGLFKPEIYLPAGVMEGDVLDCTLRHECTHLRRGHLAYKLLAQAVCALHWFNPAAWLLCRMVNEACEFDCDRVALRGRGGTERLRYCTALLNAAEGERAPLLVSAFARPAKTLRKRMEVILMPKPNRAKQVLSLVLCAALLLCVVSLTACAAQDMADDVDKKLADALSDSGSVSNSQIISSGKNQTDAPLSQSPDGAETERQPSDSGQEKPAESQLEYVWPVEGYTLLSRRFAATSAVNGNVVHRGIDIPAPEGTGIASIWDGVVEEATFDYEMGNTVRICHEDGTFSRYAHCSDILVQEGERVTAGQVIAHVGCTGNATGNHCHFEIEQMGALVDPMLLFDREQANAQTTLPADPAVYVWPVAGYGVSTKFAFNTNEGTMHRGVDIAAPQGTDIVAVRDGTVMGMEIPWSYGNAVQIDHGDGTVSLYAHCSDLLVQAGEYVRAGQVIAHVGSTGNVTGCCCHLEIIQNDVPIDPEPLFNIPQTSQQGMPSTDAASGAPLSFIPGMGCSDPTCTDASHHHDCPETCTDYSHYHHCPLNCTEASHCHGGAGYAAGGHHSEGGHHHH